ncbi:unnamed protein product [Meloidogyne enterolobii]|uniref:Uncharacterized protein n=1 Tax=Meloidogyne enterolobii TaxID=390850 RepID=A0ACB1AH44_MELEN
MITECQNVEQGKLLIWSHNRKKDIWSHSRKIPIWSHSRKKDISSHSRKIPIWSHSRKKGHFVTDIKLILFLSGTALDRSPVSFISSSELTAKNFEENIEEHLFPSGLLLFSFCGFLLVFLVGIFLFRIFKSSEREMLSSSHSRELQIVLVPKNRLIKNSPIFPVKEENLEEEQKELLNEQQQPVISGRKLFPKRIYEIQAEEGYYSCPPSMRASFEAD